MAVSRTKEGGKALMALSIDTPAPAELVERSARRASTTRASASRLTPMRLRGRDDGVAGGRCERVADFLRDAGAEARLEEFEEGTPTAADAAKAAGCGLDQIVKTLVFVADGGPVVALVPGDRRADAAKIAPRSALRRPGSPPAAEVQDATGFAPGGVAPFPLPRASSGC